MANWSEGLKGLSTGLNTLINHQIYKDKAAREDKRAQAEQRLNERMMELRESIHEKDSQFREREIDFQQERAKTEDERFEQTLSLDQEQVEIQRTQAEESGEHRSWQRQQAEEQMQREQEQAEQEQYMEVSQQARERAQDLRDRVYDLNQDVTLGEEERKKALEPIQKELDELAATEYSAAWKSGMISNEDFTDTQNKILDWIQENENMDRGGATAAMLSMDVSEVREIAREMDIPDEDVMADLDTRGAGGGSGEGSDQEFLGPEGPSASERAGRGFGEAVEKITSDPVGAYGQYLKFRTQPVRALWENTYGVVFDAWKQMGSEFAAGMKGGEGQGSGQ